MTTTTEQEAQQQQKDPEPMSKTIRLSKPKVETAVTNDVTGLPVSAKYRPAPKFILCHYPHSWKWDTVTQQFLPKPVKIVCKRGVNGVTEDKSMSKPIASIQRKGGTYIDPTDARLGKFQNYVSYYDTQNGGKWYVMNFETVTVLTTGQVIWGDHAADWREFRQQLKQVVPPMLHEIFVREVARERNALSSLESRLHTNPHLSHKLEATQKRIDNMTASWGAVTETAKKAATKKLKPKAAKV